MRPLTLTTLLGLFVAVIINACGDPKQPELSDEELAYFEKKLASGATPEEACDELDVLCKASGFGCKAHSVFCNVPTKEYICQQLAAACVNYPAACDVYNNHCKTGPVLDAGTKDATLIDSSPTRDLGTQDAYMPADQGPMKMDVGPMKMDSSISKDSGSTPVDSQIYLDM